MTEDNDHPVARALLARAVTAEPALDLDPRALARAGRRRVARRRAIVTGGVAVAVAAAVLGTSMLAAPRRAGDLQVAGAGPSVAGPDPVVPPPPAWPPVPSIDARSQRLTAAFAAAHLIPAGMTVEKKPDLVGIPSSLAHSLKPLEFFRSTNDGYGAYAQLRDSRGYGPLSIGLGATMPYSDVLTCAAVTRGLSCTERTFPDGSRARVMTVAPRDDRPNVVTRWLTVRRPNGTFLEVRSDNGGEFGPTGPTPPTRGEPPMTEEQLLQIAAVPTITY
ncbi:hypothetical protein GCM10029964_107330 [Kibdelosporangium lantanae]